jgi:hypothetical protein
MTREYDYVGLIHKDGERSCRDIFKGKESKAIP